MKKPADSVTRNVAMAATTAAKRVADPDGCRIS
jgi:hypothetical protein